MDFIEYVYSSPAEYVSVEYVDATMRFMAGGWETFIVPIAWTFSETLDNSVYWIGEFIGISQ